MFKTLRFWGFLCVFFGIARPLVAQSARGTGQGSCALTVLPVPVQSQLKTAYAAWKVQEVTDLSVNASSSWDHHKKYRPPTECPGIAVGHFQGNEVSYAVLLVPADRSNG